MQLGLPSHIWIALVADDIIVLDLKADRYSQLGKVPAGAVIALIADRPLSIEQELAALKLTAGGILTNDGSGRRVGGSLQKIPTASALEQHSEASVHIPSLVRCGLAVVGVKARLRLFGFECMIASARKWKAAGDMVASEHRAASVARTFARRRISIPIAQSCLSDSLALFRILLGCGIDATLVIGVRVQPFAAHCWVQTDAIILSDAAAPIRELTPILAI